MDMAEFKLFEQLEKDHEAAVAEYMWNGIVPVREPREDDNVKLAFVDDHRMIGIDNKTMQGYELRDDAPEIKLPLVPRKYTTFERWARMMDV